MDNMEGITSLAETVATMYSDIKAKDRRVAELVLVRGNNKYREDEELLRRTFNDELRKLRAKALADYERITLLKKTIATYENKSNIVAPKVSKLAT